jgi:hypothetical protein
VLLGFSFALPALWVALPDLTLVLPGAPRLVVGAPRLVIGALRLVIGAPRCSQVYTKFSPAHRGVPKLIINSFMVHLDQSSEIPVTPEAAWTVLL